MRLQTHLRQTAPVRLDRKPYPVSASLGSRPYPRTRHFVSGLTKKDRFEALLAFTVSRLDVLEPTNWGMFRFEETFLRLLVPGCAASLAVL